MTPIAELHGGFQSTVWLVADDGTADRADRLVVKVVPTGPADDVRRRRVDVANRLADIEPAIVGPLDRGPGLVVDVDGWSATCHRFVDGRRPRPDSAADVEAMGRTLADLHRAMAAVGPVDLPPAAALTATAGPSPVDGSGRSRVQLLHGDYGGANLLVTDGGLRVIDLDDCGLGPVEFELGNSLYLELFDAWHTDDLDRFRPFRDRFLAAYRSAASQPVDEGEVERSVQRRLAALARWLQEPATAPVGIRTSSGEWRDHLRTFVDRFADGVDDGVGDPNGS